MKKYIQYTLFSLFFCGFCSAALKNCTDDKCPIGGIWSEWSTTETCPTSCGSCSQIYYTRKCLTSKIDNCECTGSNSRYYPCNTEACAYPAQRTCCIPYVPLVINGKMQCGPFPKEPTVTSCCPINGAWSEWTNFGRNSANTFFERTRKCLVEEAGCKCMGNNTETTVTCPCRSFVKSSTINAELTRNGALGLVSALDASLDHSTCIYQAELNTSLANCNFWAQKDFTAVIRYVIPPDTPDEQRVTDCQSPGKKYITMYCDFETLYYRLNKTNKEVLGWSQVNYNKS